MNIQEAQHILGVSPNYTPDDVKKAFKVKAHECHPDKGGDSAQFIRVKEAKELLIQAHIMGHTSDNLFETLFGRKRPFAGAARPKVRVPDVAISLKQGYYGGTFKKKIRVQKPCNTCGGLGRSGDYCPHCDGHGYTDGSVRNGPHNIFSRSVCGFCAGTGFKDKCHSCNGLGVYETVEELEFVIRPGTINDAIVDAKGEFHHKVRVHIIIPENYKVFPGKILYMPDISLEDIIKGYNLDILGQEVYIEPFTFNEINVNEDILVRPQIYVKDKDLFTSIVKEEIDEQ